MLPTTENGVVSQFAFEYGCTNSPSLAETAKFSAI